MSNDSVWFSHFDWINSNNPAKLIKLDVCWKEIRGNTFTYLDASLENGFYVTIGLRQTDRNYREASMSVFKHGAPSSLFDQIHFESSKPFSCRSGNEGDKYCKGNYPFELNEYYQFIIEAHEKKIAGIICRLGTREEIKIATFFTGKGSLIKARSSNGVALEHLWMSDPCQYKSEIAIRNAIRVDVNDVQSTIKGGSITYQNCQNCCVKKGSANDVLLSHGGESVKGNSKHRDFIELD